jgi:hypothetical protein
MAYEEILAQVRLLSPEEQTRLVEETMAELRRHIQGQQSQIVQEDKKPLYDFKRFRGVGHGLWEEVGGVDEFLKQERASWDF